MRKNESSHSEKTGSGGGGKFNCMDSLGAFKKVGRGGAQRVEERPLREEYLTSQRGGEFEGGQGVRSP